ncbi:hypothetical protein N665_0230s0041 [Sinapis alba]|nr:hypothetical protein N665_0230s0041 [Sinapis alba]
MLNSIFCHPTFAMSGALAWQVQNRSLIKLYFVVWRGVRTGDFFFNPGFSSPRAVLLSLSHTLFIIMPPITQQIGT